MISVVIPLCNEAENIPLLWERLQSALVKITSSYEVIFIDDGSTDNSLQTLLSLAKKHKNIRIFSFRKNQGKSEALTLGFHMAKGEYIITLDADLQDRPEEIKNLLKKIDEGYDVVSGWRQHQKRKNYMIFASKFFNFLARTFWHVQLHDYNCGLKAYRREATEHLRLYGGMHRFIPLILSEQGFTVSEVPVEHAARKFGKSKYGFSKIKEFPDIFTLLFLTNFSKRPLHFFGLVGTFLTTIGIIFLGYLTYAHFILGQRVGTRPLWSVGILFTLVGLQVFFTGFLADLLINISQNSNSAIDRMKRNLRPL
ncbi:MAG: glycosyltransferase family 2 protein [Candidatus Levyibacteriota bacterium]